MMRAHVTRSEVIEAPGMEPRAGRTGVRSEGAIHEHDGSPIVTPGHPSADPLVTRNRETGPRSCDCPTCPDGCRWEIKAEWPWARCKACTKGRHRKHGAKA